MVEGQLIGSPVRLAYQSFGQLEGMARYQARLAELVKGTASPGTDVSILRLPSALVEGKGFASAQALELPSILNSIALAIEAGNEAVAIGNGFDPGLWEARELFDVPILGLFETVAFYGLRVGWRLGVLCSGKSGVARVEEMAARYGISSRMARPVALGVSVPRIIEAFQNSAVAGEVLASTQTAVSDLARQGAEVVMVASGALDVFLNTHETSGENDLPILQSVQILVSELESAANLARQGVPYVSRAGRFRKPPEAVLDLVRKRP